MTFDVFLGYFESIIYIYPSVSDFAFLDDDAHLLPLLLLMAPVVARRIQQIPTVLTDLDVGDWVGFIRQAHHLLRLFEDYLMLVGPNEDHELSLGRIRAGHDRIHLPGLLRHFLLLVHFFTNQLFLLTEFQLKQVAPECSSSNSARLFADPHTSDFIIGDNLIEGVITLGRDLLFLEVDVVFDREQEDGKLV